MIKQMFAVISMSLQTLPQRMGASSVIVIGIAGVVAVLVSVLAMGAGFRHTLADSGRADRVIILRGGSDAELNSNLTRMDVDIIGNAPGKGPILAFTMEGAHAHDVATIIDRAGVAVRAGTHCAMPLLKRFGVTSTCRASFGLYNTRQEVDVLADALVRAHKLFA